MTRSANKRQLLVALREFLNTLEIEEDDTCFDDMVSSLHHEVLRYYMLEVNIEQLDNVMFDIELWMESFETISKDEFNKMMGIE